MRPYTLVLIALAVLAGSAGYVAHRVMAPGANAAPMTDAAAQAPDAGDPKNLLGWSFSGLDGVPVTLERWRGRLLIVNFWATWCPPCLREIPAFVDLQERLGERGVQFVGIALDQREAVAPFVAEKAMNYPVLVGSDDVIRYMQVLGNTIGGLPYTAVIGSDGTLLKTHQGEWEAEAAGRELEALLAAP